MKFKQTLCAGLAAVLVMASPAVFASEAEEAPTPVDTAVEETAPTTDGVNVTLTKTGHVVINPYGLAVETAEGTSTEQIIGETLTITNNSGVPVVVTAGAVGRVSELSSLSYAAQPPRADTREKEIFLYAEFQNEDGQWSGRYGGGENQLLIFEGAAAEKEVLTLDAGAGGVFRLFGAASVSPADPWCSEDEISVTFTFTFVPVIERLETAAAEEEPTGEPTAEPSGEPTAEPTGEPTAEPSGEPTEEPVTQENQVSDPPGGEEHADGQTDSNEL